MAPDRSAIEEFAPSVPESGNEVGRLGARAPPSAGRLSLDGAAARGARSAGEVLGVVQTQPGSHSVRHRPAAAVGPACASHVCRVTDTPASGRPPRDAARALGVTRPLENRRQPGRSLPTGAQEVARLILPPLRLTADPPTVLPAYGRPSGSAPGTVNISPVEQMGRRVVPTCQRTPTQWTGVVVRSTDDLALAIAVARPTRAAPASSRNAADHRSVIGSITGSIQTGRQPGETAADRMDHVSHPGPARA